MPDETGTRAPDRPRGWALAGYAVLVPASALVYLASAALLLLLFIIDPNEGHDADLNLVKAVALIGWLAIGAWMLRSVVAWRWIFVAAAPAAWVWLLLVSRFMVNIGHLNWGP